MTALRLAMGRDTTGPDGPPQVAGACFRPTRCARLQRQKAWEACSGISRFCAALAFGDVTKVTNRFGGSSANGRDPL